MPLLFEVQRADILAQNPAMQEPKFLALEKVEQIYKRIIREQNCITLKQLAVGGRDLMEAGFPAGPFLGEILQYLLELVLEEPERNQKEWLLGEAVRRYGRPPSPD